MRLKRWYISLLLVSTGLLLILVSILKGESGIALFLIFPVIYGTGLISALGILLLFLGFLSFFFLPFFYYKLEEPEYISKSEQPENSKHKSSFGGIIFIGPLPVIFSSDKKIAFYLAVAALLILTFLIFIFLILIFLR